MEVELTGVNRNQIYICFCLYVFIGIGLLLSLYPLQSDIYIPFYIPYILGIILVGLVLFTSISLNRHVRLRGEQLSSDLTCFYKFFIPLSFLILVLTGFVLLLTGWNRPKDMGILISGMFALVVLFAFFHGIMTLRVLYADGQFIYLSNFFKIERIRIRDIKKFWRKTSVAYDLIIEREGKQLKYEILLPVSEKLKFDMKSTNIERFIRRNNLNRVKE